MNHEDNLGEYKECYVAFLDVLGFSDLVKTSEHDLTTVNKIAAITTTFTRPRGHTKEIDGGRLPIQVRTFSDTFVAFTPVNADAVPPGRHPLAELCMVVRYLHDRVLLLGHCVRGAISIGNMFWASAWDKPLFSGQRQQPPPLTFGPGLNEAYRLESELAIYPRVILSERVYEIAQNESVPAIPFAPRRSILMDYIARNVPPSFTDDTPFLDILHRDVLRSPDETLHNTRNRFSIFIPNDNSSHPSIIRQCLKLVRNHETLFDSVDGTGVAKKYEWLAAYADARR